MSKLNQYTITFCKVHDSKLQCDLADVSKKSLLFIGHEFAMCDYRKV